MIKQNVWDLIQISQDSKVPVLLFSNPGYGKTTSIVEFAKETGRHVESLIGSRFSPEDILGYQVNEPGNPTLVQKDPVWYDRLIAYSKGMAPDCVGAVVDENGNVVEAGDPMPSILFIDEISTCNDAVQGSLLSLVFDRKIGNGKPLPDDCVIISAANYAENLPNFMNIMAPTINRFCVINLMENYSNIDIVDEFLTPQTAEVRKRVEIDDERFNEAFYNSFRQLVVKYSDAGSTLGYIDLMNADLDGLYKNGAFKSGGGRVLNIISGRSMNYLRDMAKSLARHNLRDPQLVSKIVGGLIGLGSNNFKDAKQVDAFIESATKTVLALINDVGKKDGAEYNFCDGDSVADEVGKILAKYEARGEIVEIGYENKLVEWISKKYGDTKKVFKRLEKSSFEDRMDFQNDMDGLMLLLPQLSQKNSAVIAEILQSCSPIYDDCMESESPENFNPEVYKSYNPKLIKRILLAKKVGDGLGAKDGDFVRIGVFGTSTPSYTLIPDGVKIREATASKMIKADGFKELHLNPVGD